MGSVVSFLLVSSKYGHPWWPRRACTVGVVMTLSSPVTLWETERMFGGAPHKRERERKRERDGPIISLAQGTTTSQVDHPKACSVWSCSGACDEVKKEKKRT